MRTELKALFKLQHDLVERLKRSAQEPPPPVLLHYQPLQPTSMQFDVSLSDGKVQSDKTLIGRDIARHLNQPNKRYVADGPSTAGTPTLRMKDERQYVFHIQSTPAVAAVFKSSLPDTTGGAGDSPGRAHVGSVSAVQTTADGQQFRLDGQRLFRFEPLTLSWMPDADNRAFSRLGLTHDGQLLKTPLSFEDSDTQGHTTVLLRQGDDASYVHILGNSPQAVRLVDETGLPVQLTRIGLSGNTLHGATTDGEWIRADLRMARDGKLPIVRLAGTLASQQMRAQFPGGALTVGSNVMGQSRGRPAREDTRPVSELKLFMKCGCIECRVLR